MTLRTAARGTNDVLVSFHTARADLERRLPALLKAMDVDGGLWVAWPKRASGVPTDITEDTVREVALPLGLVDNKVCAIDDTWSGPAGASPAVSARRPRLSCPSEGHQRRIGQSWEGLTAGLDRPVDTPRAAVPAVWRGATAESVWRPTTRALTPRWSPMVSWSAPWASSRRTVRSAAVSWSGEGGGAGGVGPLVQLPQHPGGVAAGQEGLAAGDDPAASVELGGVARPTSPRP